VAGLGPDAPASAAIRVSGLEEDPFDWWTSEDGRIFISRGGRQVTVVAGARAQRLSANLESARARGDETAAQHLLARATGNYKRGNERNAGHNRGDDNCPDSWIHGPSRTP